MEESHKILLPPSIWESSPEVAANLKSKVKGSLTESSSCSPNVGSISHTTIQLPLLSSMAGDLQDAIKKQLLDDGMQNALVDANVMNWCPNARPLHALKTKGDGNCLLHAVSLAMWGMEDTTMMLRRLVYVALVEDEESGEIKKRWHKERGLLNDCISGFALSSREWEQEWDIVVKAADDQTVSTTSSQPRDLLYESLEEIHIFVLAHVLKRPIIVLAEPMFRGISGHSLAPNNLRGIYLPLLWKPLECTKSPIILGFNSLHFAPLLPFASDHRDQLEDVCPLVSPSLESLYVHFLLPHEESIIHRILQSYLNIHEIPYTRHESVSMVLSAKLSYQPMEKDFDLLACYTDEANRLYRTMREGDVFKKEEKVAEKCVVCHKNNGREQYCGKCSFCYSADAQVTPLNIQVPEDIAEIPPSSSTLPVQEEPATASLLEHQQHSLLFEGTSVVSQHCEHKHCVNLASIKTYPYCHEHAKDYMPKLKLQKQKSSSVSDESMSPLPEAGERLSLEDSILNGGKGVPCAEKACRLYALPEWDYRCVLHREENQLRQKASSTWQRCRKSNCRSPGNAKYKGFCLNCYTSEELPEESSLSPGKPINYMKITSQVSLPSQRIRSEQLCVGPQCPEMGERGLNGLCRGCYEWLLERQLSKGVQRVRMNEKCRGPRCTMFGTPQNDGYCSKCWGLYHTEITAETSLPDVSCCKGFNCDLYGDPNLRGYCSSCYRQKILRKKRPHTTKPSNEPILSEVESYARKSKNSCRNKSCMNFANPLKHGYCNECYELKKEKRNNLNKTSVHH